MELAQDSMQCLVLAVLILDVAVVPEGIFSDLLAAV
jgi:hypothetical protein